jgi:enoyl-CoA hydratase/carnithine racemase
MLGIARRRALLQQACRGIVNPNIRERGKLVQHRGGSLFPVKADTHRHLAEIQLNKPAYQNRLNQECSQ